ncbi:MAG: MarR family transcriptional regulator [Bacteroidales bacterium]|nr:MarR family transcriptional regulator [Bacteroidales bacterium]
MYEQLKLDNQVCFKLYTASRLITQAYRPLLEPLGLTYSQYLVMLVLWEHDHQTVNDISRRLMLDTNTLTPLLQRMERAGLVVRARGLVDGRQTLVSLTKTGHHLEAQAKDIPACISQFWQNKKTDLEQTTALLGTLDTMIDTIQTH